MNSPHDHVRWLAFVEGQASAQEQARCEKELAEDPALASQLVQMRVQRDQLRALAPPPVPGDLLGAALARTAQRRSLDWWRPLAAAACLLAAAGLFWMGLMGQDGQLVAIERIAHHDGDADDAMMVMAVADEPPMERMDADALDALASPRSTLAMRAGHEVEAEEFRTAPAPAPGPVINDWRQEPQVGQRAMREPVWQRALPGDAATDAIPEPRLFHLTAAQVRHLLAWLNDPQAPLLAEQDADTAATDGPRYEVRVQLRPLPTPAP